MIVAKSEKYSVFTVLGSCPFRHIGKSKKFYYTESVKLGRRLHSSDRQGQWVWALFVGLGLAFILLIQMRPGVATNSDEVRHVQRMVSQVDKANRVERVGPFEIEREF